MMPGNSLVVRPVKIPDQQKIFRMDFPFVLQNETADSDNADLKSLKQWVQSHRLELLAKSVEHGAILFRGFGLKSAEDFDAFVQCFGLTNFPYKRSLSNAVRIVAQVMALNAQRLRDGKLSRNRHAKSRTGQQLKHALIPWFI